MTFLKGHLLLKSSPLLPCKSADLLYTEQAILHPEDKLVAKQALTGGGLASGSPHRHTPAPSPPASPYPGCWL